MFIVSERSEIAPRRPIAPPRPLFRALERRLRRFVPLVFAVLCIFPTISAAQSKKASERKAPRALAVKSTETSDRSNTPAPKALPLKALPVETPSSKKKAPVKQVPVKQVPIKQVPVKQAPVKKAPKKTEIVPVASLKTAPAKPVPTKAAPAKTAALKSPAAERPRAVIPPTYGWGPALRIEQRPVHTPAAKASGAWTGSYKLGAGDQLNFALFGDAVPQKHAVTIGPDGKVSYLQARGVVAKGKTIPELRKEMETQLSKHHNTPKLVVTPAVLRSKRYTILGKVKKSGAYPLERPTTLLEGIAQGGGFSIGANRQNVPQLADLRRSFIVRYGDKLGVDFERLYALGDLTQNVYLEPNDYIYIASNANRECYVFGSVKRAGTVPLDTPLTVTGAIAASGGFGPKAWKAKVLIVRGNLSEPKTEVINLRDILHGKARDVEIQPGDIVYVNNRPWSLVEDLVDAAIRAFIQGSAAAAFETYTTISVGS